MSAAGPAIGRISRTKVLAANLIGAPATSSSGATRDPRPIRPPPMRSGTFHGRGDAADDTRDHDAFGHRRRARQRVRATPGQADHGHLVDSERVRDGAQVVCERPHCVVLVRRGGTDPRLVDPDQSDVLLFCEHPGLGRNLTAGTGRAVQPEDRASLRSAELSEPDLAFLADRDVAFELGTGDRDNHVQSVA